MKISNSSKGFDPAIGATAGLIEGQASLVLPGYSWAHYLSLDELFQNSGVQVRFLNDTIEIMAPVSEDHESRKGHVGCLIEQWCIEKDIPLVTRGSTTIKKEKTAGGEPDESYCIGEPKPFPDLAIEIALTSGGLSKRAFYKIYQVPEVWIWRNEKIEVFYFDQNSGEYIECAESHLLPGIDLKAVEDCSVLPTINEAVREFRKRAFG